MEKFELAAKELLSRRVAGMKAPRLAENVRPASIEDALQIQAAMTQQRSDAIGGWKCLLPISEQQMIVAPIFSDTVKRLSDTEKQSAECFMMADNDCVRIEPEIAFVLSQDLPASDVGYDESQINDAIGSCHMALELMQSRFADDSGAEFFERLADGLVNQGLFLGPQIDRAKAFAASQIEIDVIQGETTKSFAGHHPNGDPVAPIYWLINFMSRRGVSFKAGQAIITGSYCGIVEVAFDKEILICYQGLGEYRVTFKAE
nr:hydratase [Vibrio agarilyticus]